MSSVHESQPDFSRLFFEYFSAAPRPISYEIRKNANRSHDVQFMSSLLHDAWFKPENVKVQEGRVTIPMQRDRWENGPVDGIERLDSIETTLTIESVRSGRWEINDHEMPLNIPGADHTPEDLSLWVTALLVRGHEERPNDECLVVLVGWKWRYVLSVAWDGFRVRLQDAE